MQGGCACGSGACGTGKGGCNCGGMGMGMGMGWRGRHHGPFKKLLMLVGVIYLALLSWNAWKQHAYIGRPTTQRDTIAISAQGKVTALTDIAKLSVGVQTEKKTVAEAMTENTSKMNAITSKLMELGVAKEDIQTTNYQVYETYDYPNGKQVSRGFTVAQTVDIKVRKLESVGGILSAAGALGANQIGNVQFTIDDPEALRQQARIKGLEMAKTKAQALASAAGVKLGKVVGFSESANSPMPPVFYAKDMAMGQGGSPAANPEVQPGSQDVTVDVTVQYEILP
jgi:uncharacterized protein YggE